MCPTGKWPSPRGTAATSPTCSVTSLCRQGGSGQAATHSKNYVRLEAEPNSGLKTAA
jgi:hypothetical protein